MRMTGYTKLFGSIITSTIWREKNEIRILWITMLAMKNKAGVVEGSIPGLADMARLSIEETTKALDILSSPDPYSRTKEFEGRRIAEVDGGWLVLNHEKWRAKMNADERREYLRIKQREHRAKVNKSVNNRKQVSTESTHSEEDTEPKTKELLANARFQEAWNDWVQHRKEKKSPITPTALKKQLAFCSEIGVDRAVAALRFSTMNGYAGIFEPSSKRQVVMQGAMTKYGLPLPKGCSISRNGDVLDSSGRIMDINQVRKAT